MSYSCPNKECIETAYRCDGQNDCGCVGDGCDEHECGGLNWSEYLFFENLLNNMRVGQGV